MLKTLLFVFTVFSGLNLQAKVDIIPVEDIRLPSNDLVHPDFGVLDPEEAWHLLKEEGLDLSKLNPTESEIWANDHQSSSPEQDQIPVDSEEVLQFLGPLTSLSGQFRMNVRGKNGAFILAFDKTLHTMLLRKNLLRKLGYKIPAIKYLPKAKIKFKDLEEKKQVICRYIPERTFGSYLRWMSREQIIAEDGTNFCEIEISEMGAYQNFLKLEVNLIDIAATMPSETDHYNVAMGVPPGQQRPRVLRSLLIPYALLDVNESVNKLPWTVGVEDNAGVKLPHFTIADMNADRYDAIWMLDRMRSLTREDFNQVVDGAYFPAPVATLLKEKLISRYNSLYRVFKLDHEEIAFDSKISQGKLLEDGQIQQEDWPGYASRFAHGPPDSPFQDFGWYLFAEVQSLGIENLVSLANDELSAFNINESRLEWFQGEFKEGLDHFVETGEFLEHEIGTWVSPTLSGNLILSRDIVIGNYLGTDNLVQLADTFGFSFRVGAHIGIEKFAALDWSAAISPGLSLVRTYTHLKPVKTLKESVKEPYQNMIVPFVQYMLQSSSQALGHFGEEGMDLETEENKEAITEVFKKIDKYLGVGESVIMTDRLSPNVIVSGRYNIAETRFSFSANQEAITLKRIHLHRKDAKTIQVYIDEGLASATTLNFEIENYIPILRIQNKFQIGQAKMKVTNVNIDQDLEANPKLFEGATAISHLLKSNNEELLEAYQRPFQVTTDFRDWSTKFGIFVWRSKHLRKKGIYEVETPKGNKSEYLQVTDEFQSGLNYRSFAEDLINYAIERFTGDIEDWNYNIDVSGNPWKNPAQTFMGVAKTKSGRFESRLEGLELANDDKEIQKPFISITRKKEGWGISEKKLREEIQALNAKYGTTLFDEATVHTTTSLKLYDIAVHLNIYERGIVKLHDLTKSHLESLQDKYRRAGAFTGKCETRRRGGISLRRGGPGIIARRMECGQFSLLFEKNKQCKNETKSRDKATCLLKLANLLEEHLKFEDLVGIIGAENFYLYGEVNGFRKDSEILIDPIKSNSLGRIRSREWNGPVEAIRNLLGVQAGEFHGSWIREVL